MPRGRGRRRRPRRGGGGGAEASSSSAAGTNVDNTDPIEDIFLSFFDSFKDENDAVEFYKADLAAMTMKQSSVLRIDYLHVKEYSPKLSYALISDSERTKSAIVNAFKRYIPADSYLHGTEITVNCYNFPNFERSEMLFEFLVNNPPVVAFRLHTNVDTPVCTAEGCNLFQGFVDFVLTMHKRRLTLAGNFQATDLVVLTVNGRHEYHILKEPSPGLDHDTMTKDFKRLTDILLHEYTLATNSNKNDPPFFSNLSNALRNIPADIPANLKSMERFSTFICNHIAFLPALSRSNLIYNLMRVYRALSPNERSDFAKCVNQYTATQKTDDWREKVFMHTVFEDVYQNRPVNGRLCNRSSYSSTGMDLLRYQRNFVVHAVEYLKDANGQPTIITLEEVDYLLAHLFDKYLVEMLKRLIDQFDMKGLLEQVWKDCTLAFSKR